MVCHTMPAKFVLGVNTLQMNRDFDYGGVVDNQLRAWEHIGLFTKPLPAPPEKLPSLVDYSGRAQGPRSPRPFLSARELLELPSRPSAAATPTSNSSPRSAWTRRG